MREQWRRWWPHLRVLVVFYHVFVVVIFALPPPRKMADRASWKKERNQRELARWAETFSSIGIDVSPAALEEFLFAVSVKYVEIRRVLIEPAIPYAKYSGTRQGWRMFSSPQTRPARLVIELQEKEHGEYRPIFVKSSETYDWRRSQFDHNRLRKLHGRLVRDTHRAAFLDLARWVARKAAVDFPQAVRVRVRLYREETLPAAEAHRGAEEKVAKVRERVHALEEFR